MYFTLEWPKEGLVGLLVTIELVPPVLVVYDRKVLQSFFDEDEAVIAIFILWVFCWYHVDVGVS